MNPEPLLLSEISDGDTSITMRVDPNEWGPSALEVVHTPRFPSAFPGSFPCGHYHPPPVLVLRPCSVAEQLNVVGEVSFGAFVCL